MILSTWNFEYALQLQSTKTICFRYVSHPMRLLMLLLFKNPFSLVRPFKFIKTMLKSLHIVLGLSQLWNRYPKCSHTKGATKRSIIA